MRGVKPAKGERGVRGERRGQSGERGEQSGERM
jgi:hypothetical protein